jgi:hypothetical protein
MREAGYRTAPAGVIGREQGTRFAGTTTARLARR